MGKIFGGGGGPGPQLDAGRTDFRQDVLDRTAASRENTLKLMAELQAQSQGAGPSYGTDALAQNTKRNLAQTLSAASAIRSPGAAATMRNLQNNAGNAQRNFAEQSNIIRNQEQLNAEGQLGNLATAQQQQDLQQVMQPGSVVAGAESRRFEDAIKQAEIDAKNHAKEGAAILGAIGTVAGGVVGSIYPGVGTAAGAAAGGAIGTGIGTAAGTAASDENMKEDIEPAKSDVHKFLDALAPKKYKYKDPTAEGTAPGKRYGILAQDLEKSDMGKSLVADGPQGKMVDTVQGFGAVLAAQADMHERLKKLEKGKK